MRNHLTYSREHDWTQRLTGGLVTGIGSTEIEGEDRLTIYIKKRDILYLDIRILIV